MKESIRKVDFDLQPTYTERAQLYFADRLTQQERDTAQASAADFEDTERPMARTAVLIPVAAHQDMNLIFNTMDEYAKQKNADSFTIFLYLNLPAGTSDADAVIDQAETMVQFARHTYQTLDIRYTGVTITDPTIGYIRRELWNAVAMLAYHEGLFEEGDVIGLNHDIDTVRMSPHYMARVQQHFATRDQRAHSVNLHYPVHKPVVTRLSHAVLPDFPNAGKVTTWVDNTSFQSRSGYEAGFSLPFSHYMKQDGFDAKSITHETHNLYRSTGYAYLSGAQLWTSPRRYVKRLHEHEIAEIWTPLSFGPNDTCRNDGLCDITPQRTEEVIAAQLRNDLRYSWLSASFNDRQYTSRLKEYVVTDLDADNLPPELIALGRRAVERQMHKAHDLLLRVIGSQTLANEVHKETDDIEDYILNRIKFDLALNLANLGT